MNEYPEDFKRDMIEKHRYINIDDNSFWSEYEIENQTELLAELGFKVDKIYFSGFASQGDGASFIGQVDCQKYYDIHYNDLVKHFNVFTLRSMIKDHEPYIDIRQNDGHYCHEYTMEVVSELGSSDYPDEMEEMLEQLADHILEHARKLAKNIYRALEKEFDYLTSDEAIWEYLQDQELIEDEWQEWQDDNLYECEDEESEAA